LVRRVISHGDDEEDDKAHRQDTDKQYLTASDTYTQTHRRTLRQERRTDRLRDRQTMIKSVQYRAI